MLCVFCQRNKEPEAIYRSHQLKAPDGSVTCPQLRKYICELCGATGANAHTRSYCPNANFNHNFRRPDPELTQGHLASTSLNSGRFNGRNAVSTENSWLTNNSSSNNGNTNRRHTINHRSTRPTSATTSRPARASMGGPCFNLGSERMFLNMAQVTSTPHNSAGRLRRPRAATNGSTSRQDY